MKAFGINKYFTETVPGIDPKLTKSGNATEFFGFIEI